MNELVNQRKSSVILHLIVPLFELTYDVERNKKVFENCDRSLTNIYSARYPIYFFFKNTKKLILFYYFFM
ncbi:hypothetical protein M1146_05575 [Patescibacteria group bacterium]|nr:hypothetical protein [Patescibacteria group bacterium]